MEHNTQRNGGRELPPLSHFSIDSTRIPPLKIRVFVLFALILLLCYSNTFHSAWQMDDRPNILDNPRLLITELTPQNLWGTFFANQGKEPKLFRPLPCLTFALNWYVGQDDPWGYHLVNLLLHLATALVLFLVIQKLITKLKCSKAPDQAWTNNVALLAAVIWAIHPIQTQAVTYIVQRMAIMAGLFYVLGILFFLLARSGDTSSRRWAYGMVCFLCFAAGIASKENAILLPVSLLLVEWVFFRYGRLSSIFRSKTIHTGVALGLGLVLVLYISSELPTLSILQGYDERPFTLTQRVMTQPRILLMYLSQLFFPLPGRLSIAHDVTLSVSLFQPWTTFPAMVIVIGCFTAALTVVKRYPLLSFGVLFFFLNHAVESSIFPLELVFEHRNYLPSMFLFLPIAAGLLSALRLAQERSGLLSGSVLFIVILLLIGLGLGTFTRNKVWATPESLWRDAAIKAPNNIRPFVNLGIQLAWKENPTPANYRHAIALFQYSLNLVPHRTKEKAEILGNMASVYFNQEQYQEAIELYQQGIDVDPRFLKNRYDLVKPLVMTGQFEKAARQARYLTNARPGNPAYWNLLGFVLLWQNEYEESLRCFQLAMSNGPLKGNLLLNIGVALTKTGYADRGKWFLKKALVKDQTDPVTIFALIENRLRAGDYEGAYRYAYNMFANLPVTTITETLRSLPGNFRFAPIASDLIHPIITKAMASHYRKMNNLP